MVCHLHRGSTCRSHLPYVPTASAIRREINPTAVLRPTRHVFVRRFTGKLTRRAALKIDDKNVWIPSRARIEDNLLPVGRPTWSSRHRGGEVGKLHEVTSVASAHPDFISAAAGRFEGNLTSIWRELRTTFSPCRGYELVGRTGRNQRDNIPSPDVLIIPPALHIDQSIPSNRRLNSVLTERQSFSLTPTTRYLPKPTTICENYFA